MCVAVPMKLVEVQKNDIGIVELEGVRRQANLSFIEHPQLGEYLIIHAGFAIERLDQAAASQLLADLKALDTAGNESR